MLIILGYFAGILTLLNPCVLPLLPIIAASALQEDRKAPFFIAFGLSTTTALVGFLLAYAGRSLEISETAISNFGAIFLVLFGFIILMPAELSPFRLLSGSVVGANNMAMRLHGSPTAHTAAGAALGVTWSPCIGPTMGAAVALASAGEKLTLSLAIMLAYGSGIGTLFLLLAYGGKKIIQYRKARFQETSRIALTVFGIMSILVGIMILTEIHKVLEFWLLGIIPDWLLSLSLTV
jgi:cytochrome c biogenesis protein CcdA